MAKLSSERIDVTKTFLPPIEEYIEYLSRVWKSAWLTNNGPFLQEFQAKTKKHLGVKNFHFVGNGTIALQVALRACGIEDGEIITTPFSYVATVSSILWEKFTPVFVDIEPDTYCIDPKKIEPAITKKTKAIMPVHVFGMPCDVDKIERIAKKHNLKIIYDGAHAFGVRFKQKSLLSYGDVSTCSFHATKLFHTVEGGAVMTADKKLSDRIELMKRFGHNGDDHLMLGINAKASEYQAIMGLCNLKYIDEIVAARKSITELYDRLLHKKYQRPVFDRRTSRNYAYYPMLFDSESRLKKAIHKLNTANIFPRRYFYPSLNKLPYVSSAVCPVSEDIASRIVCLPLYVGLGEPAIEKISRIINSV